MCSFMFYFIQFIFIPVFLSLYCFAHVAQIIRQPLPDPGSDAIHFLRQIHGWIQQQQQQKSILLKLENLK